jgi:hypothetical protein
VPVEQGQRDEAYDFGPQFVRSALSALGIARHQLVALEGAERLRIEVRSLQRARWLGGAFRTTTKMTCAIPVGALATNLHRPRNHVTRERSRDIHRDKR